MAVRLFPKEIAKLKKYHIYVAFVVHIFTTVIWAIC